MAMDEESAGGLGGAIQGGIMGGVIGGPAGAGVGAAAGLLGGGAGGKGAKKARRAADAAARMQRQESLRYYAYQRDMANAIDKAMNDPQELMMLNNAMGAAERDLVRQERMIEAMDPAVKEAASQVYNLLQGKEASSMAPLRAERQRQRQTLLNTLRAQLGPGAENSSAGQQALSRFDAETSNVMAQNQQSSLSSLFSMADRGTQYNMNNALAQTAAMSGLRSGRTIQGIGAKNAIMSPAWQAKIAAAGGQYTGQMMQGQYQNQLAGQMMGSLTSLAMLSAGGGGEKSLMDKLAEQGIAEQGIAGGD